MSELFANSGQPSSAALSAPSLMGLFVPGIDNPNMVDGLGLYTPWGGGGTYRKYSDYGLSDDSTPQGTQLRDLGNSLFSAGGNPAYNFEGIAGPTGPPGPQGPPGRVTVQQILFPVGSAQYGSVLNQLQNWNAAEDTLPYGGTSHVEWNETWTKLSVATIKTWNEIATDEDGSFILIASDSGIYVSTNSGSTWALKTPFSEHFLDVGVSDASGNAVALGENDSDYGKIWKSADYGANWTGIVISTA